MAMINKMPSYRLRLDEAVYIESEVKAIFADYLETLMFKEDKFKEAVYKYFKIDEDEYLLDSNGIIKSKIRGEIELDIIPTLIVVVENIYQERMCEMYGYGVSRGYTHAIADMCKSCRRGTTDKYDEDIPF